MPLFNQLSGAKELSIRFQAAELVVEEIDSSGHSRGRSLEHILQWNRWSCPGSTRKSSGWLAPSNPVGQLLAPSFWRA